MLKIKKGGILARRGHKDNNETKREFSRIW
jgi:hypothetical protein